MDDITGTSVGMNVRRARRYQGMTLETLAGRIGRSKSWLSMVENGLLPLAKREDIALLAETLEVSADMILGQPAPEIRPRQPAYRLSALRAVLLDSAIGDPPDIPARPAAALAPVATAMDQALRHADYTTMAAQIPGLLAELHVLASGPDTAERDEALRLLVSATGSATIMLKHLGRTDLAWISADRGRQAALLLGDPVWTGAAMFGCAHARNSANKPRALMGMPVLADQLEPLAGTGRFAAEVYGMVRLSAALARAVEGDHAASAEHATEAASVAGRLGDRPDAFEVFGPSNAGVWRASLAVEAGNAELALSHAAKVEPQSLSSDNRRAALDMERARALAMLGHQHQREAVRALRRAEKLSPAQVHTSPLVRELVGAMLTQARLAAAGRELRGLAWRMGVVPAA